MKTKDLEFKGTKGNWETNLKRYEFSKGYNTIEIQVKTNEKHFIGKWIAQVNSIIKEDFEEDKANATLMANSKIMLDALNQILTAPQPMNEREFISWVETARIISKKAIEKALGHEN